MMKILQKIKKKPFCPNLLFSPFAKKQNLFKKTASDTSFAIKSCAFMPKAKKCLWIDWRTGGQKDRDQIIGPNLYPEVGQNSKQ